MFSSDVTDSDLFAIKDALRGSSVQSISLAPCKQITDDALAVITEFQQLRKLDLRETSVTNEGVKRLAALTNLRELQLGCFLYGRPVLVDDEALQTLAMLPQLEGLYLFGPGFTDAGLVHLQAVPDLRLLWFQGTGVSPQALGHLRCFNKLEVLALQGCEVGDAELRELLAVPELKRLYLNGVNVTDASVETLAQLRRLEVLSLGGTRMTPKAIAELQKALPDCKIR
jgi:hypothetical protein